MLLALVTALPLTDPTPSGPDWAALFQPLADGVSADVTAILPIVIPIALIFAGLGIAFALFRKFGVKTRI